MTEYDFNLKTVGRFVCALLMVCALLTGAVAQSEAGSAAIEGTVVDPDNKPLSGVRVTVRNVETGYKRIMTTDAEGQYVALVMPVGTYLVEAVANGFSAARFEAVQLTVGVRKTLNFSLTTHAVTEGVVVSANPATIERQEMATSNSIGVRAIGDLPIRGRNFPEFAKLTPAIVQEADRAGLVIAGQRSINSNVALDGTDFNDPLQGNQRGGNEPVFFFPQIAVREFQVIRSGATVEVGRTNAGFINVVTKSGTNSWHGEAFFLNRHKEFTSLDAFDRQLNNKQNQFGGSIGGPIKSDQAFFFVSAEQNYLRVPFFVEFEPQEGGVIVPAELRALEGQYNSTNDPTSVFARSDITLNNRDSLSVHYTYARQYGENFNPERGTNEATTANYTREGSSHGLKAGLVSVFSPEMLNEIRAQIATDNRDEIPNATSGRINISDFGNIGSDSGRPRLFDSTRYQVTDNLTLSHGAHQFRFGFDLNINRLRQKRESNIQGRYDFKSLSDYTAGKIDRFRQTIYAVDAADLVFRGSQKELAFYVQDKISLHRDLALTAGLRWEGQWNPQPDNPNPAIPETGLIPNDLGQWQPRLGLAWNVGGGGKTIVRLSAGLYNARTPANLFQRVFTDNGLTTVLIDSKADKSVLSLIDFPNSLASPPPGIKLAVPRVFGFAPDFRNPRSFQTAATLEQLVGNDLIVSVGYIHNSTWNLQRRLDRNLFAPTINETGMPIFRKERPNPTIGPLSINESSAHSSYDGLVLTATRRFAHRFQLQANYTLSRTLDDDSNERNFSDERTLNPFDLSLERGYSKQDVRHNFNLNGLVDLPYGFTFSAILISRSAFPYTPIIGFDTQNDGNDDNDRAIINGRVADRNSLREPSFFNLDMRVLKAFSLGEARRLYLTAEIFNVTRAVNKNFGPDGISEFGTIAEPEETAGQSLFAPSTARFGGPRQMQIGVRFVF